MHPMFLPRGRQSVARGGIGWGPMSAQLPQFIDCQRGLELSPIPVWVLDITTFRVIWANPQALEFWVAESAEELRNRRMLDKVPEPVLVRLRQTISRAVAGEVFAEDWTFVPEGKARPCLLHLRGVVMPDGTIGMLNQALKIEESASPAILRSLAMVRHAKATTVLVDEQGIILEQNAGGIAEFGPTTIWSSWLEDASVARDIIERVLNGALLEFEANVRTLRGPRVHTILAHGLRDPVTGSIALLIQHFDVTERIAAERLAQEHLTILQEQQREILALSTPFLDVGAHTLAVPLIGHINETRAQEITSRLLEMVANHRIERVILDITGVVSVEASNLLFLRRLVDAISLLGAKPIVTGIRSDLARMLAASDEGLSGITIKRSLAEGLQDPWSRDRRRA